jgi:hypothetical protein
MRNNVRHECVSDSRYIRGIVDMRNNIHGCRQSGSPARRLYSQRIFCHQQIFGTVVQILGILDPLNKNLALCISVMGY